MDKGDYSEVKELITTNSNCATNSPFDGDGVTFYGAAKDDSFHKVSDALQSHPTCSLIHPSLLPFNAIDVHVAAQLHVR